MVRIFELRLQLNVIDCMFKAFYISFRENIIGQDYKKRIYS